MTMTSEAIPQAIPAHHYPVRIYYEDTDAGGIIYHANYFKFAERARTEFMRHLGYSHHKMVTDLATTMVVRHAEIDYRAPGRLEDMLDVVTSLVNLGNTSLTLQQSVYRGDVLLADMKITLVAINEAGRATRIPPQLRQIFGS